MEKKKLAQADVKKLYKSPQLIEFGEIEKLTASGPSGPACDYPWHGGWLNYYDPGGGAGYGGADCSNNSLLVTGCPMSALNR